MHRILLLDDEQNILNALRRLFAAPLAASGENLVVETFTSPREALKRASEGIAFDAVISDYRMAEMDGVSFLKAFREEQPHTVRLILSGYADLDALVGAVNQAQIYRFIAKPWHDVELRAALGQALAHHDLMLENQRLADEVRTQRGIISRQEMALRQLEAESPGITKVNWGPNGEIIIDEDE